MSSPFLSNLLRSSAKISILFPTLTLTKLSSKRSTYLPKPNQQKQIFPTLGKEANYSNCSSENQWSMGTIESAVLIVPMLGTFELRIAQLLVDYFNILLAEL